MGDVEPLAELMSLLRPEAVLAKIITGAEPWSIRKPRYGDPAFCLLLEGSCVLEVDGLDPLEVRRGDFLLLPQTPEFTMRSAPDLAPIFTPLQHSRATHHGCPTDPVTMRMLGGYFRFDPASAALLVALLPSMVLVRSAQPGASRLRRIVELIAEQVEVDGPGRDMILRRLVEVLMIEAMRVPATSDWSLRDRGLIAGLADPVVAPALRAMHRDIAESWSVGRLADTASVSRAVFAERFHRTVGIPPMRYLLEWRVAVAKESLRTERPGVAQLAHRLGYRSATAFTTAFTRVVGCSPAEYAVDTAGAGPAAGS